MCKVFCDEIQSRSDDGCRRFKRRDVKINVVRVFFKNGGALVKVVMKGSVSLLKVKFQLESLKMVKACTEVVME